MILGVTMPLTIKSTWNPDGSEKRIIEFLRKLFKDDSEEIFLFHNVLLDHFEDGNNSLPIRPDLVLVSASRGIAIIEVKSWKEYSFEGNHVILNEGAKELNPIVKAQRYYFNFHEILKSRNPKCKLQMSQLKCHLVFTNLIHDPNLKGRFFETHFMDYSNTLVPEDIFNNTSLSSNLLNELMSFLHPAFHFCANTQSRLNDDFSQLDPKQEQVITKSPYGHYLVSGVPGSGKSILVISRALYLKELCPDWNILILCSNKNLQLKHQRDLIQRTSGHADNINCQTYISFLYKSCDPTIKEIKESHDLDYKDKLELYREKALPANNWDAIIVDEYQDFTDKDFDIILKSCKKHTAIVKKEIRHTESLFLAGDMLQKIREEGCSYSWDKMNIHIKGRSTILKTSYRCTSEILKISLNYLKGFNKTLEAEVNRFYEGTDDIEHGESITQSVSFSDKWWEIEIIELCNSIQNLIRNDVELSNIIIIAPNSQHGQIKSLLKNELAHGLLLTTQHTVKGLEASHVFIFNLSSILLHMEKTPTVKARMVYMLLTRANLHIHLNCYGMKNDDFNRLKEIVNEMRTKKIA